VTIGFWVDENGVVDLASVEVLESIPCLDQVCLNTIRKSKWRPAQQGRKKVGVPMTKSFKFTLN
jgi:outer membrane biosynthesis protein TonB